MKAIIGILLMALGTICFYFVYYLPGKRKELKIKGRGPLFVLILEVIGASLVATYYLGPGPWW